MLQVNHISYSLHKKILTIFNIFPIKKQTLEYFFILRTVLKIATTSSRLELYLCLIKYLPRPSYSTGQTWPWKVFHWHTDTYNLQITWPFKFEALPVFHALTGCDYTLFFRNVENATFWNALEGMPSLTQSLINRKENPESISSFRRSCDSTDVNEARMTIIITGLKTLRVHTTNKKCAAPSAPACETSFACKYVYVTIICGSLAWKKSTNIPNP